MELEDELINEDEKEKPSRPDNRIKDLADKVRTTAEERDKEASEKATALAEKDAAKKETEFYKNFNGIASKYEGSIEFQDKIKEKVDAGYDLEDATVAILNREGRLTTPAAPVPPRESPAGGSATTTLMSGDEKALSDMSTVEKREALMQIERESGGVSQILRRGL